MTLNKTLTYLMNSMPNKAEKMKVCEELGIEFTNKTQEIINQVLILLRDERSSKTEWTTEDAINFRRLCSYSSYNKMKEYLDLENRNFIKFFINWYDNKYQITSKVLKRFSHTIAEKDIIKTFNNLNKYLTETSVDWAVKQQRIENCKNALIAQLGEFKRKFLDAGAKIAEEQWNGEKNHLWSLDEYIKREVDNRERYYNFAMISLAERLIRNGVDEENIKVNYIQEDYKLFEMGINDGKSTWHARSIVAAEYSDIVTCHLRFIVTKIK